MNLQMLDKNFQAYLSTEEMLVSDINKKGAGWDMHSDKQINTMHTSYYNHSKKIKTCFTIIQSKKYTSF